MIETAQNLFSTALERQGVDPQVAKGLNALFQGFAIAGVATVGKHLFSKLRFISKASYISVYFDDIFLLLVMYHSSLEL